MSHLTLALWAVLGPLFVAVLLLVAAPLRRRGDAAAGLSLAAALGSFVASAWLAWDHVAAGGQRPPEIYQWQWLAEQGATVATVGLQIDGISASMLVVVSLVALCVQVFSLGYMADEPSAGRGRYFTWHALFLFSMQALVVSPNLLQLFCAWELVGLCSYLLIGFYYDKPSAARAALKAFWVTKFADIGLLLGLIVQYTTVGSFGWDGETVIALRGLAWAPPLVAGLYFLAVMGKSAQFPLHIWLPDAMEGPTPVSALLHAATMVAAGVYLVVRAFPIFESAPAVLAFMGLIGGFTALFAALLALVQTDIKRVLAYSTCSQLGYMVAALGAGGLFAGYFHLFTHAFFKALLFLAAGSVIHAVHSNAIRDMGGLFGKMKLTSTAFIVGALALAGVPAFSGFFSKDQVLEALLHAAQGAPIYWVPLVACLITVALTATYMTRVVLRAFFGPASAAAAHAHEGGLSMRAPLVLLALLAVGAGYLGGAFQSLVGAHGAHFSVLHLTPIGAVAVALTLGGAAVGYALRDDAPALLAPIARLSEAGAVDRAWAWGYQTALRRGADGLAWVDRYVVDGAMNAVGAGVLVLGERARRLQTGVVSDYLYAVAVGVVCLAAWSQLASQIGGAP